MQVTTKHQRRGIQTRRRQRGYNLVEITLYAVVAAILAGVTFKAYSDSNKATQIGQAARDLQTVAARIVSIYPSSGDFSAIGSTLSTTNCATAVNNQAFANTVFRTSGTGSSAVAQHFFGQGYVTCSAFNLSGASDAFILGLTTISDKDCPQIVKAVQGSVRMALVDSTTVQGYATPLAPDTVGTACQSTSYTNNHTLQFVFART